MMTPDTFDSIIIGAGPGGLQAAIHLARFNRAVLLLDHGAGRTRHALHLENYLGLPLTTGKTLIDTGISQIRSFGARFRHESVDAVSREDGFIVTTDKGRYQAPFVIASSGASENMPKLKGMNRFFGKTVFTCVDCDGYRTSGKQLVILGDSLDAVRLALGMKQMFTTAITLVLPPGLLPEDHAAVLADEKIAFRAGKPDELLGRQALTGVRLHDGTEISCDVVMLSYGFRLNDAYLAGLSLARDGDGFKIMTDHGCETSMKNLFAVGALKPGHAQAIIAAGQGAMVAIEINQRLLAI